MCFFNFIIIIIVSHKIRTSLSNKNKRKISIFKIYAKRKRKSSLLTIIYFRYVIFASFWTRSHYLIQ